MLSEKKQVAKTAKMNFMGKFKRRAGVFLRGNFSPS